MSAGGTGAPTGAAAYWHTLPGVCNHPAFRVGGECNRPDEGVWTPLYPAGVQSRADHTITDEMVRVAVSVYYGWALDQPGRSLALEARMRAALRAALGQGTDDQEADA